MANYVDIDKTRQRQDVANKSATSWQQVVVMDFEKQHDKTDFRSVVVTSVTVERATTFYRFITEQIIHTTEEY